MCAQRLPNIILSPSTSLLLLRARSTPCSAVTWCVCEQIAVLQRHRRRVSSMRIFQLGLIALFLGAQYLSSIVQCLDAHARLSPCVSSII